MNRALCYAVICATVGVYLVMLLWSLPRIAAEAGGQVPFDLRPGGYGLDEARAFLAALTPEGRAFYLGVQHRLDLAYPALLALSLGIGLRWGWRGLPPLAVAVMVAMAVAGSGFDYLENSRVSAMLAAEPDAVTADLVASANRATVLKSVLTTVAMLLLVAGLLRRGWIAWRAKR